MTEPQPIEPMSQADILSQAAKIIRARAKPENMARHLSKKQARKMAAIANANRKKRGKK